MKANKLFWILWFVWLILNVLTGLMQEIYTDESYYHLYGQYLAWGYYDHPPMVGLMAWLSEHLLCHTTLPGLRNLTVRLMTILTHGLTVWLLWRIVIKDRPVTKHLVWTFLMVAASMVMFSTAGFMLTPDSPLLLFVALFYYAYQQYLQGDKPWQWALVLSIAIAGMLYSKYMGVLVAGFTVLSNWRLIKDGRLWCAIGLALLLLMPHLWWQYSHDFPSLQYHLVSRHEGFDCMNLIAYWPNQLVVFNPLSIVLMLCAGWVAIQRKDHALDVALGTTILGFLGFFWFMAIKGRVEPHWTMAASVPAIILLTRYIEDGTVAWMQGRWVRVTLWVMVGLCTLARIVLWTNLLPVGTGLGSKRVRYDSLHELTGDRVYAATGSFQWVSMYRFWEGDAVLSHDLRTRRTQYEFVDLDYAYQGVPACVLGYVPGARDTVINGQDFHWKKVQHLQLTDRMQLRLDSIGIEGDCLVGRITAFNPYAVPFVWQHTEMPVEMRLTSLTDEGFGYASCKTYGPDEIPAQDSAMYRFVANWHGLTKEDRPEQIRYILSLTNGLALTQNSPILTFTKQ